MNYGAWFLYFDSAYNTLDPPQQLTPPIPIPDIPDGCGYSQTDIYADEFGQDYLYNAFYYSCGDSPDITIVSTFSIGKDGRDRIGFDTVSLEIPYMACTSDSFLNVSGEYTVDMELLKPAANDALWVWSVDLDVVSYDPAIISKNFGFPTRFLFGRAAVSYYDYLSFDLPISYKKTFWGLYEFLSSPEVKDPGTGLNVSFQTVRIRGNKLHLKLNPSVIATVRTRCCLVYENLNGWL